jgi:cation diffusion facilitator CzcD-associated flavoprotein CzcO
VREEDIVVIGAGPAGLAVSASLRRERLPHLVLEHSSELAPSWQKRYDRLHLHTTKHQSALPFTPFPRGTPRYPSRADVVAYLHDYAERHDVRPRFGVEARRVLRGAKTLVVETSAGRLEPRAVVVATGFNRVPNRPDFPGLVSFAGSVTHSDDYRNAAPYAGKRTLVVGCGNSGAEIALDLAEHGVEVAMVVRGPVHVVPRDLFGRPSQYTAILLSRLPVRLRDALAAPLLRLAVGDLSRWGIVRPAIGPNEMIEEAGRIPMLDIGTIAQVKAGRIRVFPAVTEVERDRIRFVDGRVEPFDAIVLATGYRPALGELVEDFESMSDGRGRPRRGGAHASVPGLFFVGFTTPATGALRQIAIEAPRVAAAVRSLA